MRDETMMTGHHAESGIFSRIARCEAVEPEEVEIEKVGSVVAVVVVETVE